MTEAQAQRLGPAALVTRLGGHPLSELGLDPQAGEPAWGRWLVACTLLSTRHRRDLCLAAFGALSRATLADPAALASADPAAVARVLHRAGLRDAAPLAARLVRAARRLAEQHGGSLGALARGASDLEDLAGRIASLAPGIGTATVARFLQPLRDLWPAAREVPLAPAARAAAHHLGWIGAGDDEPGEPTGLRAALAAQAGAPPLYDLEAALERLGAASCARERPDRCPLGGDCPLRREAAP